MLGGLFWGYGVREAFQWTFNFLGYATDRCRSCRDKDGTFTSKSGDTSYCSAVIAPYEPTGRPTRGGRTSMRVNFRSEDSDIGEQDPAGRRAASACGRGVSAVPGDWHDPCARSRPSQRDSADATHSRHALGGRYEGLPTGTTVESSSREETPKDPCALIGGVRSGRSLHPRRFRFQ